MPVQGISLHIGLNRVDPVHYGGWDGELLACEFDAKDMKALADGKGFRSTLMLTASATADAVVQAISAAAKQLKAGDLFLLTYSGHGGQVPDRNGDETDPGRQDETWVLYDRQLIDDELWALWGRFKSGVRILVFSDSCHSGTVTRQMPAFLMADTGEAKEPALVRMLPPKQAAVVYRKNAGLYDGIQKATPAGEKAAVRSTVLLVSGCQDNQFSLDGRRNGLFTGMLKKVWNKGKFEGGYRRFRDSIAQRMPAQQTPNYLVIGKANPGFEAQTPFTI